MLRPVDIVVLLKLSLSNGARPPYLQLANELHLYPSEVYASIKRVRASHFVQGPELKDWLNRSALLEFLLHGIRYVFPAECGALTRGMPTRYAASPLKQHLEQGKEQPPVWPYAEGSVRGYSYTPLHKNVPKAALADPHLYELLGPGRRHAGRQGAGARTGAEGIDQTIAGDLRWTFPILTYCRAQRRSGARCCLRLSSWVAALPDCSSATLAPLLCVGRTMSMSRRSRLTRITPSSPNGYGLLASGEDSREGAPLCRWRHGELVLDVMPLITAPYFLGTKIEAFHGRGHADYSGSNDLEDFITVIDGRPSLLQEVGDASPELRAFVAEAVRGLLAASRFLDALPGHLSSDAASQARIVSFLAKLEALSKIG